MVDYTKSAHQKNGILRNGPSYGRSSTSMKSARIKPTVKRKEIDTDQREDTGGLDDRLLSIVPEQFRCGLSLMNSGDLGDNSSTGKYTFIKEEGKSVSFLLQQEADDFSETSASSLFACQHFVANDSYDSEVDETGMNPSILGMTCIGGNSMTSDIGGNSMISDIGANSMASDEQRPQYGSGSADCLFLIDFFCVDKSHINSSEGDQRDQREDNDWQAFPVFHSSIDNFNLTSEADDTKEDNMSVSAIEHCPNDSNLGHACLTTKKIDELGDNSINLDDERSEGYILSALQRKSSRRAKQPQSTDDAEKPNHTPDSKCAVKSFSSKEYPAKFDNYESSRKNSYIQRSVLRRPRKNQGEVKDEAKDESIVYANTEEVRHYDDESDSLTKLAMEIYTGDGEKTNVKDEISTSSTYEARKNKSWNALKKKALRNVLHLRGTRNYNDMYFKPLASSDDFAFENVTNSTNDKPLVSTDDFAIGNVTHSTTQIPMKRTNSDPHFSQSWDCNSLDVLPGASAPSSTIINTAHGAALPRMRSNPEQRGMQKEIRTANAKSTYISGYEMSQQQGSDLYFMNESNGIQEERDFAPRMKITSNLSPSKSRQLPPLHPQSSQKPPEKYHTKEVPMVPMGVIHCNDKLGDESVFDDAWLSTEINSDPNMHGDESVFDDTWLSTKTKSDPNIIRDLLQTRSQDSHHSRDQADPGVLLYHPSQRPPMKIEWDDYHDFGDDAVLP